MSLADVSLLGKGIVSQDTLRRDGGWGPGNPENKEWRIGKLRKGGQASAVPWYCTWFPRMFLAQESPSSHRDSPPEWGRKDTEQGQLPPTFPWASSHSKHGGLGPAIYGPFSLESHRQQQSRSRTIPRNFPDKVQKFCLVSSCSSPHKAPLYLLLSCLALLVLL